MPCEKTRRKELSDMVEHKDKDIKEISKVVLDKTRSREEKRREESSIVKFTRGNTMEVIFKHVYDITFYIFYPFVHYKSSHYHCVTF